MSNNEPTWVQARALGKGFPKEGEGDPSSKLTYRLEHLPHGGQVHVIEPSNSPKAPAITPVLPSRLSLATHHNNDRVHLAGGPEPPPGLGGPINLELYVSYIYLSMSYYFDRDDVVLKDLAKYFLHQPHEEREHAEKLMKLQTQRVGQNFLQDIKKPDHENWENGLDAMECALDLGKNVVQSGSLLLSGNPQETEASFFKDVVVEAVLADEEKSGDKTMGKLAEWKIYN
ncbi:hypothetical protein QTO34_006116 [Cnephaeus nilssonii]|uniref:Ferritin n=1 Tax=Cnephaeus nilssonii TaxID=3371016 RepID=A0AA40HM27_CNENI|nr:hypothetical protein QTO34_006116 [Eptesicus nilssonii]